MSFSETEFVEVQLENRVVQFARFVHQAWCKQLVQTKKRIQPIHVTIKCRSFINILATLQQSKNTFCNHS